MKQNRELKRTTLPRAAWPVGALVLTVLIFAAGSLLSRSQAAAAQAPAATPPAMPATTAAGPNVDQYFIQGLRQALSDPRLNAADRQALQKKLAYSEQFAAQRAVAPAAPRGPKGTLVAPVPMPQPLEQSSAQPEERILSGSEGMLHTWEASITNMWEGLYNNVPTQVFAGSTSPGEAQDQPVRGLLIVIEYPPETSQPVRRAYQAPAPSGALTILNRQGHLLRCSIADSSTLFFNLETRAFEP